MQADRFAKPRYDGAEHGIASCAELRIAGELFGLHHAAQHLVRSEDARLAFDLNDVGIRGFRARHHGLVDDAQIDRSDHDLAHRAIAWLHHGVGGDIKQERSADTGDEPALAAPEKHPVFYCAEIATRLGPLIGPLPGPLLSRIVLAIDRARIVLAMGKARRAL